MKRHEALQPLSREHHETLILSQLLKIGAPAYKGLPGDNEGKIIYAKALFDEKIARHFLAEERIVEKLKETGSILLIEKGDEIIRDHEVLRQMFNKLSVQFSSPEDLDILGKRLEGHVRMEERIYFPLVENLCTPEMLNEVAKLIEH